MPYIKESSGGQPAGRIIEAKSNYGPSGAEAVDIIDPRIVLENEQSPAVENFTLSFTQWILLVIVVIVLIYIVLQIFNYCCGSAEKVTRNESI